MNASSGSSLSTFSIEIGGPDSTRFKSISSLSWRNIPRLAILTGLNGSGKTQFLELLAYKFLEAHYPGYGELRSVKVQIEGETLEPGDILFLSSEVGIGSDPTLGFAEIQGAGEQIYQMAFEPGRYGSDLDGRSRHYRFRRRFRQFKQTPDREEFIRTLSDDFIFMLDEIDVVSGLSYVFVAYRLKRALALEEGTSLEDFAKKAGPPPWDVVNEIFKTYDFPYRVNSPAQGTLLSRYIVRLEESGKDHALSPNDLSSGEKVLLRLVIWIYNTRQSNRFPKLLLMDEPDAHLHPSMTRHFLDVIKDILVNRYGIRVIMTTHSPSTVALAPESSLFVMNRSEPRITQSNSAEETINLLTTGLVTVFPGTRFVLVEDDADVMFYKKIWTLLTDSGPSRDPSALSPSPNLVFLPASYGKGSEKIGGGCSVVEGWVNKFNEGPLRSMFKGLKDRDSGNTASDRIQVLSRYSIENYLLDPFVLFGVLLDEGSAPPINGVSISGGEEHLIRQLENNQLQAVVEEIAARALPQIKNPDVTPSNVQFTNGRSASYPAWMLNQRGHDLLPVYQSVFGGHKVISPNRLYKSLQRTRLIPIELVSIMKNLQA